MFHHANGIDATERQRLAQIEAITGWPISWAGWAGRWAALQWHGATCDGRCGLVWFDHAAPCFAVLTFDPARARRAGMDELTLAAAGLSRLGLVEFHNGKRFVRMVRARRVSRSQVEQWASESRV